MASSASCNNSRASPICSPSSCCCSVTSSSSAAMALRRNCSCSTRATLAASWLFNSLNPRCALCSSRRNCSLCSCTVCRVCCSACSCSSKCNCCSSSSATLNNKASNSCARASTPLPCSSPRCTVRKCAANQ